MYLANTLHTQHGASIHPGRAWVAVSLSAVRRAHATANTLQIANTLHMGQRGTWARIPYTCREYLTQWALACCVVWRVWVCSVSAHGGQHTCACVMYSHALSVCVEERSTQAQTERQAARERERRRHGRALLSAMCTAQHAGQARGRTTQHTARRHRGRGEHTPTRAGQAARIPYSVGVVTGEGERSKL